jgi:predicted DNA-binding transcriptional regulator AlpA
MLLRYGARWSVVPMRGNRMPRYNFTLIVEGADLQTEEAQDALFEAGCDDATIGSVDGVQFTEFDREANSYAQALTSAIVTIQRTISGARVVHVEPDELVTMSEIAERIGRSRESIRLLIAGQRGPGDFPSPVSHVQTRNRLWRLPDVLRWFATRYEDEFGDVLDNVPENPDVTAIMNALLTYRRYEKSVDDAERRQLEEAAG